ncbi:MAG: hypothetical protein A3I89_02335 [Candidatus Harrisonbacteria bacterium RIFCSPLOWO2_02_FULL_41_11]|uniref:Uncharacterized protein n=1 Tax=Candidatus Harrisonbacteria bacterium RIFCSPHIGHO2_02_FULL_42_16 TaxID=1798404 RepID=A0A1G1ZI98_9BACT|nr:MAG: hypothetical protein A3B92_03625 [Candidatus Harrisonbacteria bacterium RIFCSPHIGHO2_02_FULL_42_16]OGY66630.1 MAG: hypothetical protein A3I89_02335 [Candidatus Harrisonbacteria bacterium RIFCSPLOWO2_02_FULL_41_11]
MAKKRKQSLAVKRLYADNAYWKLRQSLSNEEKQKILKIEHLCAIREMTDPIKEYFYLYRKANEIAYPFGLHITRATAKKLKYPFRKILNYLIRRAGELRGVKFS